MIEVPLCSGFARRSSSPRIPEAIIEESNSAGTSMSSLRNGGQSISSLGNGGESISSLRIGGGSRKTLKNRRGSMTSQELMYT
jgi:hypothetical protein